MPTIDDTSMLVNIPYLGAVYSLPSTSTVPNQYTEKNGQQNQLLRFVKYASDILLVSITIFFVGVTISIVVIRTWVVTPTKKPKGGSAGGVLVRERGFFGFNRYAQTRPRRVLYNVYKRFCRFSSSPKKKKKKNSNTNKKKIVVLTNKKAEAYFTNQSSSFY